MKKQNQSGFHVTIVAIAVVVLGAVGFVGYRVLNKDNNKQQANSTSEQASSETGASDVTWSFDNGSTWESSGTVPQCPSPLLAAPADMSLATAVLYPGQTRGGDYKAHGGFIFGNQANNNISVKAPMDAQVYRGSRYIETGEHQFLFDFINSCGIMFRFDHLLDLTPKFQALADKLPAAKVDSTQTTLITNASVKLGEEIATAVGFPKTRNVSFDLGVYDLMQPNAVSKNASYAKEHSNQKETAFFGICWLDSFDSATNQRLKDLPGGDGTAGKTSDYCK